MITVRDKLMDIAATDAERELLRLWMEERPELHRSRQRAWVEVAHRARPGQPDLLTRW